MLMMLLAFVITILVIVAVHEYGHYITMRWFGVRVLTFSIGFGPRLLQWRNRNGTDFVISAIPLGGYVKPLDRRDCDVGPDEEHEEFSGKPPWQRIITYAAGPAANLLLAIAIYWGLAVSGETGMAPVVGEVQAESPAEEAGLAYGDEILSLEGRDTRTWRELGMGLVRFAGEDRDVEIRVRGPEGTERAVLLAIGAWADDPEQDALAALGIRPRATLPVAGKVVSGSAAERAGLREGDRVLRADGQEMESWVDWVHVVQDHPDRPLSMEIERDGERLELEMTPEAVEIGGELRGQAGVQAPDVREIRYGMLEAVPAAAGRMWDLTTMIFSAIGKMITGNLSWQNLGGPITIAQVAGETASVGPATFLTFLAFFSVSLGVINLLPIPVLDGGWIVFGLVEMVRRRPLSERFIGMAQSVGIVLIFALMALAIYNDVMRQIS